MNTVTNQQTYEVAELDGHDEQGEPLRDTVDALFLKTCPFCGVKPQHTVKEDKRHGRRVRISCPNQLCPIYHVWFGTVLMWNRRSS